MTFYAGPFLRCSHGLRRLKADLMKLFSCKLTYFTVGKTQRLQVKQGKNAFFPFAHKINSILHHTRKACGDWHFPRPAVTHGLLHMQTHIRAQTPPPPQQRKQKKTCKPSGPSQLFPLSLPLVPFNILRQVKVFWVALNSAAPIIPVHITTVLTCSDCNLRRDVSISEFKSVFFPPFMILSCDWQGTECECDIWQAVTRTQTDNSVNTKHVFTDSETQGVNITRRSQLRCIFQSRVDLLPTVADTIATEE